MVTISIAFIYHILSYHISIRNTEATVISVGLRRYLPSRCSLCPSIRARLNSEQIREPLSRLPFDYNMYACPLACSWSPSLKASLCTLLKHLKFHSRRNNSPSTSLSCVQLQKKMHSICQNFSHSD